MVNPFKYQESLAATKEALEAKGLRVLISQAPCILYEARITGKKRTGPFSGDHRVRRVPGLPG